MSDLRSCGEVICISPITDLVRRKAWVGVSPAFTPRGCPVLLLSRSWITGHIRRSLLKPRRNRRVAMPYRARMLFRFLLLSAHAARSNLRGALSAKVSSLPPEAFGLVPPLRDNRLRISVSITILRMHSSASATVDEQAPFTLPSGLRDARCSPALTLGAVHHLD